LTKPAKRLAEVDLVRALTAMGVILLHTLGYFAGVDSAGSPSYRLDQILIELMRYSRQVFILISGLVLAYSYREKAASPAVFWPKRARSVGLPYVAWTLLYLGLDWVYGMRAPGGSTSAIIGRALLTGDAYYHLYYIVVSLQFYLIFPWLLPWLRRLDGRRAIRMVIALGAAYLGLMAFMARHPFSLPIPSGGPFPRLALALQALYANSDRLLLSYLPYFLFGALAGLHLEEFRAVLERHRSGLAAVGAVTAGYLAFDWFAAVVVGGQDFNTYVTVFRPAMFLYSLAAFGLLYLGALALARSGGRLAERLRALAPHTFGIYLIHPMVLFLLERYLFVFFDHLHPLLIAPLWLAALAVSYETVSLLATTPLGPFLFGTTASRRKAEPVGRRTPAGRPSAAAVGSSATASPGAR